MADRYRDLLVGDQVFQHDFRGLVFDDGAARIAVKLLDLFQFLDDYLAELRLGSENRFVLGNRLAHLLQLVGNFVDRELGQAMQLQFEYGVGLLRGERLFGIQLRSASSGVDVDFLAAKVRNQVFTAFGAVGAAANDHDHVIEVIERGQVT